MKSSAASKTISHYRILSKLGEGGMGEVYLAEDTRLGRKVAIKFIAAKAIEDQRAKKRFLREAQAAAALEHPNVCAIYEIGEQDSRTFIVMQYAEGETLAAKIGKKLIEIGESLTIALQVADALVEAHSNGIVHRDIKPHNIIITPRGQAKVLDFGLARMTRARQTTTSEVETASLITEPGVIVGTIPYMSPEQIRGEPQDARSDIFSFGAVLYEMVTGKLPFECRTTADAILAILTQEPLRISHYVTGISKEFERIIYKCLNKDIERRYQSARDLSIDLEHLQQGSSLSKASKLRRQPQSTPQRRKKVIESLAVLPFVNASNDAGAEYLSDGITESIINNLSQLPKLRVMARSTVFRYKGKDNDPQETGSKLGVRAVLTGRVLEIGDRLVIGVELVDVADGSQLWGEQYQRSVADIFAVQDEISREVSEKLRLKLTGEDKKRLTKRYTDNTEAYQLYLKGRYFWNQRKEDALRKGIEYFETALLIDSNYALAYSGLADCYNVLGFYSALAPSEAFSEAKSNARKALQIDATLAEAHASLAYAITHFDWEWVTVEAKYKKALELKPNYATGHQWYGWYFSLLGRFDEAISETKRAQELDPLSLIINSALGWVFYLSRDYDRAIEQYRKALEMDSNFYRAHLWSGRAYVQRNELAEALCAYDRAKSIDETPEVLSLLGHAHAVSGNRIEAVELLSELTRLSERKYVSPYFMAVIYAGLKENDHAFEWLERAFDEHSFGLVYIKSDPILDDLRLDPRFSNLLRRVGLLSSQ